jgi:hypothetical protein
VAKKLCLESDPGPFEGRALYALLRLCRLFAPGVASRFPGVDWLMGAYDFRTLCEDAEGKMEVEARCVDIGASEARKTGWFGRFGIRDRRPPDIDRAWP